MPQVTICGEIVYNLRSKDINDLGGTQGGVKDGRGNVFYSTIFRNVTSMAHARTIIAEINRLLVANKEVPITTFIYNHCKYNV